MSDKVAKLVERINDAERRLRVSEERSEALARERETLSAQVAKLQQQIADKHVALTNAEADCRTAQSRAYRDARRDLASDLASVRRHLVGNRIGDAQFELERVLGTVDPCWRVLA